MFLKNMMEGNIARDCHFQIKYVLAFQQKLYRTCYLREAFLHITAMFCTMLRNCVHVFDENSSKRIELTRKIV